MPDLIGPDVRLLFVGINPGLWTAASQTHFAHPGNRFYPALLRAGIIDRDIDRSDGMTDADRAHLIERGIGITNVVRRTTARGVGADGTPSFGPAASELRSFVAEHRPAVVAIAGITAYRTAFREPNAPMGEQPGGFEGARLWVVPNPVGSTRTRRSSRWRRRTGRPLSRPGSSIRQHRRLTEGPATIGSHRLWSRCPRRRQEITWRCQSP